MAYTKDLRAKATQEVYRAVVSTCETRGIYLSEFIREAVNAHLGIKDILESKTHTIEEKTDMIESLSDRIKEQGKTIIRLLAIDRIHKQRSWWARLRNKQITGEDVDRNIAETHELREKAIHGEET